MDIYLSADIEGCTGLVTWGQAGGPREGHFDWAFARRMMTHDVNAAIRGARKAGAERIVVKDSHNTSKNLLIDELEDGVELISGFGGGTGGMMAGINDSFDAALLIGYHAMAGTAAGVMEHTITGGIHRFWINDMPAGEIALSAGVAGGFGVPIAAISSDQAGCDEAAELVSGIAAAPVKHGMARYMARLKHPSVTGPMIEEAVVQGLGSLPRPWKPIEPVTVRIEQNRSEEADIASLLPGWERLDGYTYELTADTWAEAHERVRQAMSVASNSAQANR